MRTLITGGAGFIGSAVADAYLAAGHDVAVVDDLSSGDAANLDPRVRLYRVDVAAGGVEKVFDAERPEVVNHHAAHVSVRRSVEDPQRDATINVLGAINVLEAARRHGTRRVIFASTGGAIYGEQEGPPADESHPCRPRSPYAVAKLAVEYYLDYYRAAYGLDAIVLRYANVYGPRQNPHGEAGVVAALIERLRAGGTPTIFGDGEQVRDYVYVGDVVRANMAALHADADAGADEMTIVNIGTGVGTTVNRLWSLIAAAASAAATPVYAPARAGDVRRSVLDASRAKRTLAWEPEIDLADGIRRTWAWFGAPVTSRSAAHGSP
jgi:UDP-glucose 4-epimerase